MIGNEVMIVSSEDGTVSTMTVYNNDKARFDMISDAMIRKGKRVKTMTFPDFFTYTDDTGALSTAFDLSQVPGDTHKVFALKDLINDSVDILQLYEDPKSLKERTYHIKEITSFRFVYPYMAMIKGGNEIFIYDFSKFIFGYCKMNCPMVIESNTETVKNIISIHGLFDVGPFFVYGEIVAKDANDVGFTFSSRYIEKKNLIPDRILTIYDPVQCLWNDAPGESPGFVIHTVNYLHQFNIIKYNSMVTQAVKLKQGDIIHLNGTGLLVGKRGDKQILYLPVPLKVSDYDKAVKAYKAIDSIRSINFQFEDAQPFIYI